jgi:hypothetical protein
MKSKAGDVDRKGKPGRKPLLGAEHGEVLRVIVA